MPGFDRTGPLGKGAMTGKRMGKCSGNHVSDSESYGRGRRSSGRGSGFGRGSGYGKAYSKDNIFTSVSEKTLIENEINVLKDQLSSLEKKLDELMNDE